MPGHSARSRWHHVQLGHLLTAAALGIGTALGGAPSAAAVEPGADLAVGLDATASPILPMIHYDVVVTNRGPNTLSSATVMVQLDPRVGAPPPGPCLFDRPTSTLTCSYAGLAAGATGSIRFTAYFSLGYVTTTIRAAATRTASTPADPNGANDSDTATCRWDVGGVLQPGIMRC